MRHGRPTRRDSWRRPLRTQTRVCNRGLPATHPRLRPLITRGCDQESTMNSVTVRKRFAILAALLGPALLLGGHSLSEAGKNGDKSALDDPAALTKLFDDAFGKLKKAKKTEINKKTYYYVEGDLRKTEDELRRYAQDLVLQYVKYKKVKSGDASASPAGSPLMIHVVNGKWMRWEPGSTLKYCVLRKTFGDKYDMVVKNMAAATQDWTRACNI